MGKLTIGLKQGALKAPISVVKEQPSVSPTPVLKVKPEPVKEVIEVIKEVVVEKVVEKPVLVEKVEYKTEQVPVYIEVPKEVVVERLVEVPVEVIKEVRVEVPVKEVVIRHELKEIPIMPKWAKVLLVVETLLLLGMILKQIS